MFDTPINKMDFRQLRNAVQALNDELAVMKRKYEDIIYNLDTSNFSKSFTVEHDNMKAKISVTADAIKTMVSNTDLEETLKQYSTFEQTAEKITSTVTGEYVKTLIGDTYVTDAVLSSEIIQSADSILSTVSAEYETKAGAEEKYSTIEQRADSISTTVSDLKDFKESVFTQTADGFTLDGKKTTFTGVIFITNNDGNKRFDIFHDESQGHEQVLIGSYGGPGLPITIGSVGDTLRFDNASSIVWGKNAPIVVFG